MCEVCECVKVAVPAAVPFLVWLGAWLRTRLRRPAKRLKGPVCPCCGPVPRGAAVCLCYEHYSQNFSYSRLFLEPMGRVKEEG